MKKYKKITILAIMVILMSFVNAYAADEPTAATVTLNPSKTEVNIGETFTVTMLVKCETGICNLDSTLNYDKTQVEFAEEKAKFNTDVKFSKTGGLDANTGEYKLSFLEDHSRRSSKRSRNGNIRI